MTSVTYDALSAAIDKLPKPDPKSFRVLSVDLHTTLDGRYFVGDEEYVQVPCPDKKPGCLVLHLKKKEIKS
jgi:hypothetical protein